jgi:hypothetical protein
MPDYPRQDVEKITKLESTLQQLEERVKFLEERIELLIEIADPEKDPFVHLALEVGLTKDQIEKILDLMDKVRKEINAGKSVSHHQFESKIYEIVPSRYGDYKFAEAIVLTLKEVGKYEDVYEYMKKNGMNI